MAKKKTNRKGKKYTGRGKDGFLNNTANKMPMEKNFNGKRFVLGWSRANGFKGQSKSDAQKAAKNARSMEAYARVVKDPRTKKYHVYLRERDD